MLRDAQAAHPAPVVKKHRPRVLYATQGAAEPPTFTLFATRSLPPTYLRYLERKIRESFDLGPTPDQDAGQAPSRIAAGWLKISSAGPAGSWITDIGTWSASCNDKPVRIVA